MFMGENVNESVWGKISKSFVKEWMEWSDDLNPL